MKILRFYVESTKLLHTVSSLFTCICIIMFTVIQNQSNLTHRAILSSWEPNKKWERLVSKIPKCPSGTTWNFPPEANHLDWLLPLEWYLSVEPLYCIGCMALCVNKNSRLQSTNPQSPVRPKDTMCFIRVYGLLVYAYYVLVNTCYFGLKQIQVGEALTGSS